MRKRKVQWLAAACVFCLAQPVWAATESTTVYQDQLDSVDQSYLGEISKASTPENSNIRVVRRGEKAKSDQPTEQLPTRIDADKMSYTGSTGDVYAQGDVVVTQGNQTLMAPRIEGNTKTTEYRTVGGYRFLENGTVRRFTMFNISVDEYFYPSKKAEKSTVRRQIDSSLDLLSDNELKIIQGTIDGILNSREDKK